MYSKYEHIKQLYIEKISGVLSADDELKLGKMLDEDEECRKAWAAMEEESRLMETSTVLESINVESELKKLKDRTVTPKHDFFPSKWASVAAVLIVISALAVVFLRNEKKQRYQAAAKGEKENTKVRLLLNNGITVNLGHADSSGIFTAGKVQVHTSSGTLESITGGNATALNTLIVPPSEDYSITLADGSVITLNSDSRLRFPADFRGGKREVYLEGEAYFTVAPDAKKPFIVHTELTSVQVLGTSFNLNTYKKGVVTASLVSGSVRLIAGEGNKVTLTPGLESEFTSGGGFVTRGFDSEDVLSWMKGVYYFHDIPLSDLRPVIKRWFGTDLVLENDRLAEKRISGLIEKNRLDDFLKDLRTSAHLRSSMEGNALHLTE